MNPKIEEIVKIARGCAANDTMACYICEYGKYSPCNAALLAATADIIEQLQQELADERYRHDRLQDFCVAQGEELSKLKEQQRWIPGTERLPEEDTVVLACDGDNDMTVTCYYASGFMNNVDLRTEDGITHWMPLPAPPKE